MDTFLTLFFLLIFTLVVVYHFSRFFAQGGFAPRSDYRFFLLTHLSIALFVILIWMMKLDLLAFQEVMVSFKVVIGLNSAFILSCFLRAIYPQSRRASLRIPLIGALLCLYLPFSASLLVASGFLLIIFVILLIQRTELYLYLRVYWKLMLFWFLITVIYFLPLTHGRKEAMIAFTLIPFSILVFQLLNMLKLRLIFKSIG